MRKLRLDEASDYLELGVSQDLLKMGLPFG